ncbi:phage tail protein [Cellvibrio mixtus]|jgi:phage tail sheath protein FI|uniref:Phage tail protein n=1 Tax=Cellvibrio mixtus TaxID=39650 RepID=A0A266QC00_9GAMM|nr:MULTISPECIES: phage tail sheath C-terminal domain-containing protein [Cellvibrio]AQT61098.1 phage tail protein [Cellvibrio sp. PSBB023]OZY87397.1 phage tail protein [Cellvibrio mixtus]
MAGAYKTPGVYIVEKDAFPNSVVEVATAVPAFIGYTEFADNKGKSLLNKPWRISSMAEFISYFGGPPPAAFAIARKNSAATAPADLVASPTASDDEKTIIDEINSARAAVTAIAGLDKNPDIFSGADEDFSLGKDDKYFLSLEGTYYLLYRSMMLFFQNGGGACYVVSVGNFSKGIEEGELSEGIQLLKKEQEPTMLVIPDAVSLPAADCFKLQQTMLSHCGYEMKNRFAILDVFGGFMDNRDNECIDTFRNQMATNFPAFGAVYYPWLNSSIVPVTELSFRNIHADSLATLVSLLTLEVRETVASLKKQESIIAEINKLPDSASKSAAENNELHKTLSAVCPLYNKVLAGIQHKLNLLPPSAAMAGIYTMVDNTRGVWKAPANVSLSAVSSPTVNINHEEQEDLNVNTAGKSINAIRTFIGEGTLVWGARTLDGNSLDWRYINVRRTMIMLEESVKLATKAYVFEPNVANTWVTIKSMISNFLTSVWKRGGLAGSSPDDAFSVHVGLGETMTAEDILEGILRVTVLVALSRPAEFIEITFQQQMQKS